MKEKIKERGDTVIAEIDRPIMIVRDKDNHYFVVTESKLGQLVACNIHDGDSNNWVSRFIDLQDDLKGFDEKLYEPHVAKVEV